MYKRQSRRGSDAVAATKNGRIRIIAIGVLVLVIAVALIAGIVLGAKSCGGSSNKNFVNAYATTTRVEYYSEQTGTVDRVKPVTEIKNEGAAFGNAEYPKFGRTLSSVIGSANDSKRAALIREANYLTTSNTWNGGGDYNMMDAEGKLYFLDNIKGANPTKTAVISKDGVTQRQLYEHTAAEGMYGGNVSDDEPRVIKQLTFSPRSYTRGYNVTGLYAPAGEVIKIVMSEEDMKATGGIEIHIGQALYNGKANNIWVAKGQMQRFPVILNTWIMNVNSSVYDENEHTYTAYVGSFLGGPIYIRNRSVTFSTTISGGVNYAHFILGYTTPEEYAKNATSSAPYFDLEVWDNGVLHSGPKRQVMKNGELHSYDYMYKAAILWEKVSLVTTTGNTQGIVFLYEPFVAAGAAVAFPGQGSVNCPEGWMARALNCDSIVSSGSWGDFPEYPHNFQGYGVGNGGEVTNNAMTLVSYSLFTQISSKRGINNYGAQNLGGWNDYTSATWALEQTLKIARPNESPSNGNQGLSLYATLLHNFGQDAFIKAKVAGGGQSYAAYMNAWQKVTHNNMYYYFHDILGGGVTNNADESYPMFVPVSSVYQTGRSYTVDGEKKYFKTMQPYVISRDTPFTIDLNPYTAPGGQYASGSIVMPDGFDYTITNVTQPAHGTLDISNKDNKILTYTADAKDKSTTSGEIIVTLSITKKDGSFTVEDVDLVLEFELSREMTKNTLTSTTYTYSADKMYKDAEEAYKANFTGFDDVKTEDHSNPTQNCNTDIWLCTTSTIDRFPKADPEKHLAKDNTIKVIEGKLYFDDDGDYRIYLRGRKNCAVYYSMDGGNTYQLGATIKDSNVPSNSAYFRPNDENSYFDLHDVKKGDWMYFKEVLIVENINASQASYIGLGRKQWTDPIFTMVDTHYDANGKVVESTESEGYDHTITRYYDSTGKEEPQGRQTEPALIPPLF